MHTSWKDFHPKDKLSVKLTEITDVTPPVVSTVAVAEEFFETVRVGNKYQILDAMVKHDPELAGIIKGISFMCAKYYDKIVYVSPDGVYENPEKVDDEQAKTLLTEAQRFASADYGCDYRTLFRSCGKLIMKFGDVVIYLPNEIGKGITQLQWIPIFGLTAIEELDQINQVVQIFGERVKWYILNEGSELEKRFKKEDVLHISYDQFGELVKDLKFRTTFGVWSTSPIWSLRRTIRWKINTILNDMLWRHRSLPREWHKLNLSQFTADKYTGTQAEKNAAALRDAQKVADDYAKSIKGGETGEKLIEADQVYVTDQNTEITYVEPKTTTYRDPNLLIDQMNKSIYFTTGFPHVGEKSYAAAFYSTSFGLMQAEVLAEQIKESLETLLRRHLKQKFSNTYSDIELGRIQIATRLILERDRSELARQIALLDSTDSFLDDELRAMWNKGPLTQANRESIAEKQTRKSELRRETSEKVKRNLITKDPAKERAMPQRKETDR